MYQDAYYAHNDVSIKELVKHQVLLRVSSYLFKHGFNSLCTLKQAI